MYPISRKLLSVIIVTALAGMAGTAMADTTWQKNHPRREQVNNRLANQNKRIHQDVKNGTLSKSQAAALHESDHQIRQEERDMAGQNGGHITKSEQKVLNQQENAVSNSIPPK
jgi:23S rRNA maturation mini-RNase III